MFFRSSSALVDVPSDLTRVESFGPEDDPADCGVTRKDVESSGTPLAALTGRGCIQR
jgi:hypothetical protein